MSARVQARVLSGVSVISHYLSQQGWGVEGGWIVVPIYYPNLGLW